MEKAYTHQFIFIFLLICALLFPSCAGESQQLPDLPETQVLYAANSWGVTILPYLPIYHSDSIDAPVLQLLRRGDIVEVREQRPDAEFMYGDRNHWYRILHNSFEAWAFGAGFRFFPTEDQAHDAAQRLLHGENF